jgi:hypothetical protein
MEQPMKHVRKAILAGSAFLCATSLSFGWSDHGGVSLSIASAQARVGRPATPVSVAGVTRRHVRRGAAVGAGLAGAAAVGTGAAIGSAYAGYGYGAGPYEAYDAMPYGAYGAVPYGYGYGSHRLDCAPGPRVGAFATAPWTDARTCPPY